MESYAQEQLHSSTQMLLALEAILLIHTKGIDWNANNTMRQMFLQVNGLGLPVGLAAAGLGVEGGEMATAMDVEKVAAESEEALAENVATIAAALQFPYYFGENGAAFSECITDLDWLEGDAYLL